MSTLIYEKELSLSPIENSMDEMNGLISLYGSHKSEKSRLEAVRRIRHLRSIIDRAK